MINVPNVPGLRYVGAYLSGEAEARLIGKIDEQPWLADLKRRVQHYGYRYDYKHRSIDHSMFLDALPDWAAPLAEKLCGDGYVTEPPDQLIVNEYLPGQGIVAHVDCEPCFGDTILSLSLGSACVMDFTHKHLAYHVPILLEPRSLVVMQNDARYEWKHGIARRSADVYDGRKIARARRISLTFRNIILPMRLGELNVSGDR